METNGRGLWVLIALLIIGLGIYLFIARPSTMTETEEPAEMSESMSESGAMHEDPTMHEKDLHSRKAPAPATDIANDAAEALRQMNEDAHEMMENPEEMPSGTLQ